MDINIIPIQIDVSKFEVVEKDFNKAKDTAKYQRNKNYYKEYIEKHKEKVNEYKQQYFRTHKDHFNALRRERRAQKMKEEV